MPDEADKPNVPEIPEEDEPGVEQHRIGSDQNPQETIKRATGGDEDPPAPAPTL